MNAYVFRSGNEELHLIRVATADHLEDLDH